MIEGGHSDINSLEVSQNGTYQLILVSIGLSTKFDIVVICSA